MPTFEIGLDDGRKLHIEADDQAAALAGAQHFTSTEAPKDTSLVGGLRQGMADAFRGISQTAGQVPGGSADIEARGGQLADQLQAPNYDPAKVIDKDGVHPGNIPRAIAENVAPAALPVIAKSLAGKLLGPKLGLAAGLATAAAEYFGPNVHSRADAEGHTEPTTGDKLAATGTTAAQMAADAVLLKRFGGAAADISPGQAVLKNLATAGIGGASTGAQSAIGQVGSTVGTPGGTKFDPTETANAALGGAATAGAMGAPKALAEAHLASKFSQFGGDNQEASAAVANRLQGATDKNLASPKVGKEAFDATKGDIQRELRDATRDVAGRSAMPADVDNALSRAASGGSLTQDQINAVKAHVSGDPDAARLMGLVRQAQITQMASKLGFMTGDEWGGGAAGAMKKGFKFIQQPLPAVTAAGLSLAGLHGLPGFMGMYAPITVGAGLGAYGLAKLAGKMTGSTSPANQFAQRFANPAVPVRGTPFVTPAPQAPVSGLGGPPRDPGMGPVPNPTQGPWGARKSTLTGPAVAPAPPPEAPAVDPAAILKSQIKDAMDLMDARRSNEKLTSPTDQMKEATAHMAARASNVKLAAALAKARGERNADEEAARSPAITDMDTVSQPGFGSRASKLLSAQSALNRLRAQPPKEAPPKSAPIGNSQPQTAPAPKAPEKIASAAIRVDGKIYHQGNGHYEAIENATKHTGKSIDELTDRVQNEDLDGFYTSHGRYVSRDEAMKISAANNQTKEGHTPANGKDFSTEMIDHKTLQDVSPDAPPIASPVVTKVSKANGKVKHETASPMHDALADAFEPKTTEQMPFYGMDHDEVADAKMADKYKNVRDKDRRDAIRDGIISGRMADEAKVRQHLSELPDIQDRSNLLELLEHLHHTSSRQRAREARNHYVRLLPPEIGKKVMSTLSDAYINKSKLKD